jgi:hypothetical protein
MQERVAAQIRPAAASTALPVHRHGGGPVRSIVMTHRFRPAQPTAAARGLDGAVDGRSGYRPLNSAAVMGGLVPRRGRSTMAIRDLLNPKIFSVWKEALISAGNSRRS